PWPAPAPHPSREPLSPTTISSSGKLTIARSDHSRNAVSSRVLYDTVRAATLPRLAPGPAANPTTPPATSGACHMTSARASDLRPSAAGPNDAVLATRGE